MVFNFFLRLLVQKLEISKKRTEIVENVTISARFTRNTEDRFFLFVFFSREFFCSAKIAKAAPTKLQQLQAAPFAAPN